jgi:membrane-associated protein
MIPINELLALILNLDQYLSTLIQTYSLWTYAILFAIVFIETGVVIMPFLPGDSLLFAVGSFCALGALDLWLSIALLATAAILGDTANYFIGQYTGPRVFRRENSRLFRKEHLDRTRDFYRRHGKKTIFLARFVPIVRTFAPFVAGVGRMSYFDFLKYNVLGGVTWVLAFTLSGYFFGTIPLVRENFSLVILMIIAVSFLPAIIGIFKSRQRPRRRVSSS